MKKILITGTNSYIGRSLAKWLEDSPDRYSVEAISVRGEAWKEKDFSAYDVVFHAAGIAHVSRDPKMEEKYYKVNRDLTIKTAEKAKNEDVKQFIFMSSIIVYGDSTSGKRVIDRNTVPEPSNFYGNSKLQAEEGIKPLESDNFKVAILRPPMIYGKGSKGNYPKLAKAARMLPVFPDIDNQRSMLHIDNLCEFIRLTIENEESGLYFPQNSEYVKTSEMVRMIGDVHGKRVKLVRMFNPILRTMNGKVGIVDKVFGNLIYDKALSEYKEEYQIRDLRDSIMKTEKGIKEDQGIDVLLMSDNGLETVGGEQESTKIIIKGMHNYFNVGVIQPGDMKNNVPGIKYFNLTSQTRIKHLIKKPISFLKYILKVRNIVKAEKPKIIHTQAQVSFFIVALLRKVKLLPRNTKFIHTERGLYTKYNNFFKKLFLFFMKELDVLVTTTEFNLKYWKNAIRQTEISLEYTVIENTAGQLFETFDKELVKEVSDQLVIGFAGRYADWKNWPLAVDISKKLNECLKGNLCVKMAVGCLDKKAEEDTKVMFGELNKLLGNRFSGMINIDIEAMDKFYYDIDVFILTSNYNTESFGRTLVEAMSRKTIVLTTNAGGSVEVVDDTANVLDGSDAFVDKVLHFYNDRALMNEEKENNLIRVSEKYSLNNNINKHKDLYAKAINCERDSHEYSTS